MQRYYSTPRGVTNFAEELEDDGRSLLAKDQWRQEIAEFHKLEVSEEYNLVECARSGDEEAKVRLIESCFPYVYGVAMSYASQPLTESEVLDLVQVGNEAILRHFDESLKSRYITGFLCLAAKYAIIDYCIEDKAIRVPTTSYQNGARIPLTVSLTKPFSDDDETCLLDVLPDVPPDSFTPSKRVRALNGAIERLRSAKQRAAVRRRAGLPGYGFHSHQEVMRALGSPSLDAAQTLDKKGRRNLREDARLRKVMGLEGGKQRVHKPNADRVRVYRLGRFLRQRQGVEA